MLRSFVRSELAELWDAERVHLTVLPHMVTVVKDVRKQRMIRSRIPQAHLHAEQLHQLLKTSDARDDARSCSRIRQLARNYERASIAIPAEMDELAVVHLLRMDDYSIAALTFALRCAEAIADTSVALTLTSVRAERYCARDALAECSASPDVFRGSSEFGLCGTSNRHRPTVTVLVDGRDGAVFDDVRHAPHITDAATNGS